MKNVFALCFLFLSAHCFSQNEADFGSDTLSADGFYLVIHFTADDQKHYLKDGVHYLIGNVFNIEFWADDMNKKDLSISASGASLSIVKNELYALKVGKNTKELILASTYKEDGHTKSGGRFTFIMNNPQ